MDTNNSRGLSIAYPRFTDFALVYKGGRDLAYLVSIAYPRFTDFAPVFALSAPSPSIGFNRLSAIH